MRVLSIAVALCALVGTAAAQEAVDGINLDYRIQEGDYDPIPITYEGGLTPFLYTEGAQGSVLTLPIDLRDDWHLVLMEGEVTWTMSEYVREPPAYRSTDFYAVALVIPLGGRTGN